MLAGPRGDDRVEELAPGFKASILQLGWLVAEIDFHEDGDELAVWQAIWHYFERRRRNKPPLRHKRHPVAARPRIRSHPAIVLIALLTFSNTRGLRVGKIVQNSFTFTKTAALIGVIADSAPPQIIMSASPR